MIKKYFKYLILLPIITSCNGLESIKNNNIKSNPYLDILPSYQEATGRPKDTTLPSYYQAMYISVLEPELVNELRKNLTNRRVSIDNISTCLKKIKQAVKICKYTFNRASRNDLIKNLFNGLSYLIANNKNFHDAANRVWPELIKIMNVDKLGPNGAAALHCAAINDEQEKIDSLINLGANVNVLRVLGKIVRKYILRLFLFNQVFIYDIFSV